VTDIRDLPRLEILPVYKFVLHEHHDSQRTPPIAQNIQQSGVLRNPPIVVALGDGSDQYVVLDGANRTTAVQSLGVPHILAQVVPAEDPGLEISSWNHVIWGISPVELLHVFMDLPNLVLQPTDCENAPRTLMDVHSLAVLCCPDGQAYDLRTPRLMVLQHVEILNAIVDSYKNRAHLDRTQLTEVETLQNLYPEFSGLLILPPFRIEQILHIVGHGGLMPPGSTRFTISPRALHLNYPLEKLASQKSLQEKNAELRQWVSVRLSEKRVRYYAEATYLFDE